MRKIIVAAIVLFYPYLVYAGGFERNLYFGMRNDSDVTRLQEFLAREEVYDGPVTGNFFALTRDGVKKFQQREGIAPVAGYFGLKTRERANQLFGATGQISAAPKTLAEQIGEALAQIKALQDRVLAIQQAEVPGSGATASTTETTRVLPKFLRSPRVAKAEFISNPPLGAHYPYRVTFDWAGDPENLNQNLSCSPGLKSATTTDVGVAYFPEPGTEYTCAVTLSVSGGSSVRESVIFLAPVWVSVVGTEVLKFPDVEANPLKIGEFRVYNGTAAPYRIASFKVYVSDEMDSSPNRNRKVYFILRDGLSYVDTQISKTDFTFLASQPSLGSPYVATLELPFDMLLEPGEERRISLWVERMLFVKSGTMIVKTYEINSTNPEKARGGFNFTLTKEPPL